MTLKQLPQYVIAGSLIAFEVAYFFLSAIQYKTAHVNDFYMLTVISGFLLIVVGLATLLSKIPIGYFLLFIVTTFSWLIGFVNYHDPSLFFGMVVLSSIAISNLKITHIVWADMLVRITLLVILVLLYRSGLVVDTVFFRSGSDVVRHTFGFVNPNSLGIFVLSILTEILFITWNSRFSIKFVVGFLILVVGLFFNHVTDSRSAAIGLLLVLGLYFLNGFKRVSTKVFFGTATVAVAFSILSVSKLNAQSHLWQSLNQLMSYRLEFNKYFFDTTPLSVFGHSITQVTNVQAVQSFGALSGKILTNSYLLILLGFGLMGMLTFYLTMLVIARRSSQLGWNIALLVITVYLVLGLMENSFLNPFYNVGILMLLNTSSTNVKE